MPGFLGGSSSGSGSGGEISFPKEFIDPVTKLRVSTPENLIDTDFEYGLQPTKWETVELINNTPSFFSKSGDTTIPDMELNQLQLMALTLLTLSRTLLLLHIYVKIIKIQLLPLKIYILLLLQASSFKALN